MALNCTADRRVNAALDAGVLGQCDRLFTGFPPSSNGSTVPISVEAYDRLLGLVDQAPLEGLALTGRTLTRAKTLGYTQVGQVRCTTVNRLVADLGVEPADELLRALFAFGLSPQLPLERDTAL